jgi:DNA recombination protein RmuC
MSIGLILLIIVITILCAAFVFLYIVSPRLIQQVIQMADQKLGAEKQDIRTDLQNKKDTIEMLVKQIQTEVDHYNQELRKAEKERVGSFGELKNELENQRKLTDQLVVTTESLKKVLSNNQLRGQFGEQVAEDLLQMAGFVKGIDYDYNQEQQGSETRPDFTIYLPNKTKINVDVKFPYSNLQKLAETKEPSQRHEFVKKFEKDVRDKIKQVATRNYINPEDNTVDFVILFIPNEMIFSYIYDKMNNIWADAMRQKVVFAGPFSFTAILRLIRQAHEHFQYQKNIRQMVTAIKHFEKEFKTYNDEFLVIGERIESLSKQYTNVNTTRTNQLIRSIEKVKTEDTTQQLPS